MLDERETAEPESWLRAAARISFPDRMQAGAANAAAIPRIGDVVAEKYRIEACLGEGGMGAVFRATHLVSHKPVAIKWLKRSIADVAAVERFTREARAAGRITHPNVVDIYDIGLTHDSSYLVMELLRGESLADRGKRGQLSPTSAVELLLPALRGLVEIHRQGVIHRDLKPANIFLPQSSDGAALGAKVLDFGISMLRVEGEPIDLTLTSEGTFLGTPAYMAPEQLQSAHSVDERTDIYAIGVILYELIGGALPFQATNFNALVIAIVTNEPRPLRELCPGLPVALAAVVARAMHRDRAERFRDVSALIEALLPFTGTSADASGRFPIQASDTRVATQSTSGRNVMAGTLVMAVLTVAGWWLLRDPPRAPEPSPVVRAEVVVPTVAKREPVTPLVPVVSVPQSASAPEPHSTPVRSARVTQTKLTREPAKVLPSSPTPASRAGAISADDL